MFPFAKFVFFNVSQVIQRPRNCAVEAKCPNFPPRVPLSDREVKKWKIYNSHVLHYHSFVLNFVLISSPFP